MFNNTLLRTESKLINTALADRTVVIGATAHATAGKCITPLFVFERAFSGTAKPGWLRQIKVILEEAATTTISGALYIFNDPVYQTGTTVYATGDTLSLTKADCDKLLLKYDIGTWTVGSTGAVAWSIENILDPLYLCSGSTEKLYGVYVNDATNSITNASKIYFQLAIEQIS